MNRGVAIADSSQSVSGIASELLRLAKQCVIKGRLSHAETLLDQSWALANEMDATLANSAAWQAVLLNIRNGQYGSAATWMNRVSEIPDHARHSDGDVLQVLQHLCRVLAQVTPGSVVPAQEAIGVKPEPGNKQGGTCLAPLEVLSLGVFQVIRAGAVLPPCSCRKPIALFRYLLIQEQRSADREQLMDIFWPEASPHDATRSLHVAVSTLRRYLDASGSSYLVSSAGCYWLAPEAEVKEDSVCFQKLVLEGDGYLGQGTLMRAKEAYTEALNYYGVTTTLGTTTIFGRLRSASGCLHTI